MKKILIGGSPCTKWSIAQSKEKRETTPSGEGWEFFLNYLIAKDKFQPDFFLYENNSSASKLIKEEIKKQLNSYLVEIDSALLSAQSRKRFYCTNFKVKPPNDAHILLQDILEFGSTKRSKSKTVRVGGRRSGWGDKHEWDMPNPERTYTLKEIHRLQTLPDEYCKAISEAAAWKCLGNGWTASVISYILGQGLSFIPKDEELIVLSLYDGIGTGYYCLQQLGFTNIQYYAYEIDKNAIKVAIDNYPDIIECGNAFSIRKTLNLQENKK